MDFNKGTNNVDPEQFQELADHIPEAEREEFYGRHGGTYEGLVLLDGPKIAVSPRQNADEFFVIVVTDEFDQTFLTHENGVNVYVGGEDEGYLSVSEKYDTDGSFCFLWYGEVTA